MIGASPAVGTRVSTIDELRRTALSARLISNLLAAGAYAATYAWSYIVFLHPNYESAGYDLFARTTVFWIATVIIALLPVLCYRGPRAVSSLIATLIYFVLYVPIVLTFAFASEQPLDQVIAIQLTFMLGMAMLFLADFVVVENPVRLEFEHDLSPVVVLITAAVTLYVLGVYRNNLGFSSFGEDLYEQRADNESLGAGLVMRYASSWLSTVFAPLCFAYGFVEKKRVYAIVGALACLVMYMAAANKISILLPFVSFAFYLFARSRLPRFFPWFGVALCAITLGLVLTSDFNPVIFVASAVLLMRTIGNGGQLTVAYYDFFATHPQTGYSHVSGLGLFTHPYPYGDLGIGQVIGEFYWSPFMNANANFWATDGLAAAGLLGVVLISLVGAAVFAVMNSITADRSKIFVVICFMPFIVTLLNQSLFSSLWSGGAILMLVFFAFNGRAPLSFFRSRQFTAPSPVDVVQ